MKTQRFAIALTITNFAILGILASTGFRGEGQDVPAVLRAQRIELVDATGQVRGSLEVAGDSEAVLRLRDSDGAIRVKIGGASDGSGLILYDGGTEPAVRMVARSQGTPAKPTTTSVRLVGPDGQERVIAP